MRIFNSYNSRRSVHFLTLCLVLSSVHHSSAAFVKFNEIQISAASWKPLQVLSNLRSSLQCAVKCYTSYDCTAFCYDEALQQCELGRKGPVVKAAVPLENKTCSELPGNYKVLFTTGRTASGNAYPGSEIVNLESSTQVNCPAVPSFPEYVWGCTGTLIQKKIPLVCSGYNVRTTCYLLMNNAWNKTANLKNGRYYATMLPNSPFQNPTHQAIIIGGFDATIMEVFDGTSWSNIGPALPTLIAAACILYTNPTTIFIVAGQQGAVAYSKDSYYLNVNEQKWVAGPKITNGRQNPFCGRIRSDPNTEKRSTIIAGGGNVALLDSVEILDDDSLIWRPGPKLLVPTAAASMFEDPRGGVVVIGGNTPTGITNKIYRLRHAGLNAQWELLAQQSQLVYHSMAALPIPDEIAVC